MFTREEFAQYLRESAKAMSQDRELNHQAFDLIVNADKYNWIHQTEWFGEPSLQLPQDLFAFQKIIFKTRPEYIIELGVAWAGSLLFYATLINVLGGEQVIGVDIYIPDDLRMRINSHDALSQRITLINGSSIVDDTVQNIKSLVKDSRRVMIILDTFHTHEHVAEELRLYSPLVGEGYYLICCDTHIETIPQIVGNRPRPWGSGNNPKTAVDEFLMENSRFKVDEELENTLLLTLNPGGYLRCVRD